MLDFHDFSVGMAAAAVRIVLRELLQPTDSETSTTSSTTAVYAHDMSRDLHIITGHATHRADKGCSVLQPVIISMLKERGIDCQVNPDNKGRLIVRSSKLQRYVAAAAP